jgi:hypothetical protein
LRSRLQQLSSAQLEELAEAMLNFTTKADLVNWLDRQQLGWDRFGVVWAIASKFVAFHQSN